MSFWRNISPTRAIRDLRGQMSSDQPHRWRFMALAAAVTASIFMLMFQQEEVGLPKPPKVIYFNSWRADRTDAEIIKGNIEATEKRKREDAEYAAGREEIRQRYKAVAEYFGMDTKEAMARGLAEREAQMKADQARREAILKEHLVPRKD